MTPTPPVGSNISVKADTGDPVIVIPGGGSVMRYGVGLFILCWLGGWFFGLRAASLQLLSGTGANKGFVAFWLGAWVLGGAFALYTVYRIFQPSIPETMTLRRNSLVYDSGIPPFQTGGYRYRYADSWNAWKSMFPKRTIAEIDRNQLSSLRLRETDSGNRLTLDVNASRLDLASGATEVDREWLYRVLAERYALTAPRA